VSTGNAVVENSSKVAMPPFDHDRGDFPSLADGLARRREIHERKCKSGLRKRREIFLGYPDISFCRSAPFRFLSGRVGARRNANQKRLHGASTHAIRVCLPIGGGHFALESQSSATKASKRKHVPNGSSDDSGLEDDCFDLLQQLTLSCAGLS
jgi:hypothetical protein